MNACIIVMQLKFEFVTVSLVSLHAIGNGSQKTLQFKFDGISTTWS